MLVKDLFKRINLNIINYIDICTGECLTKNCCTSLNSISEGKVVEGKTNLNSELLKLPVDRYELLSARDYKEEILSQKRGFDTNYKMQGDEKILRILIDL